MTPHSLVEYTYVSLDPTAAIIICPIHGDSNNIWKNLYASTRPHGITIQRTVISVVTSVQTSNLALRLRSPAVRNIRSHTYIKQQEKLQSHFNPDIFWQYKWKLTLWAEWQQAFPQLNLLLIYSWMRLLWHANGIAKYLNFITFPKNILVILLL